MSDLNAGKRVAVVGATGYIGGRLVPRLLERGYTVRAVARSVGKLKCRPWGGHERLETAPADVLDADSLREAIRGCDVVYYLVHSMSPGTSNFADADKRAAANMALAAGRAGIARIIYLGGLGEADDPDLSHHLRSRLETGRELAKGPVPVTTLRAAMIIGSGSASFEIMRYLVERLPVMVTPKWVRSEVQPIAVSDVLAYLIGCLDRSETTGRTFDIGGSDVLTYQRLFTVYAQEAGLSQRIILPVPLFSPTLSSYWIHLVTPVPASLGRPLAEGLKNKVVCTENEIRNIIPIPLLSVREAVSRALARTRRHEVETCWTDAGEVHLPEWIACGDAPYAGGTVLECNWRVGLACEPQTVWRTLQSIGGENGWYYADSLWWLRGLADRLVGGVGLRRGRRDPEDLRVGDALDFWRVTAVEQNHRLQLLAEMKTPGEAVFQFLLEPSEGGCTLSLSARFLPRGLAGILYWYSLYPAHGWLFKGMLMQIAGRTGCTVNHGPERFSGSGEMCRLPKGSI